jgi:iron complex transport system substrate-binding protein
MTRIVSLLPSATEIVAALGFADSLIGRSHECDHPPGVETLPPCTEPKIELSGTSGEIDQKVRAIVQEGLSVYRVHSDTLKELRPQVIVTQSHCEVCAVSERELLRAVQAWLDDGTRVVTLKPDGLADIWTGIADVAAALGVEARGASLVDRLQARMAAIASEASGIAEKPGVACIEWIDPLMAGGDWMPELVAMAGGINLFGEAGKHAPWIDWEQLQAADPDVIVILPCGFDIDRARRDMPVLTARAGWNDLKAVREGRVYVADGHQFFNRPGPRIVESLEILVEMLHPGEFDFGHRGECWQPL